MVMALLPDQKFSTFQAGGDLELGDIIVGLRSGINTQFTWSLPAGVDTLIGTLNEVLVNGTVGVPQTGNVTLSLPQPIATTSSPTFANLQLTSGIIRDVNSNIVLELLGLSSAVNFLQIYNGATTKNPAIVAAGSDSTVDLAFASKGARFGFVDSVFGSGNFPIIRLSDSTQTNHMNLSLTAGLASEYTILFPNASGTVALTTQTINWSGIPGTSQPAAVNSGYIIQNASQTTVTLPATAAIGSIVAIAGLGAAGWILAANTGQTIKVDGASTSSGGSLTSAGQYDSIEVVCVSANTTWVTRSAITAGFTIT